MFTAKITQDIKDYALQSEYSKARYSNTLKLRHDEINEIRKDKERRSNLIQMAKKDRKRDMFWAGYLLIFFIYLASVISALITAQVNLNWHTLSSADLYKVTLTLADCNYHITNSLMGFFEIRTAVAGEIRGILNQTDLNLLTNSFYVDDFYLARYDTMNGDYIELGEKLTNIALMLSTSKYLKEIKYSDEAFKDVANITQTLLTNPVGETVDKPITLSLCLNLIQSISAYRTVLGIEKGLTRTASDAIVKERRVFMIEAGFEKILESNSMLLQKARFMLKDLTTIYSNGFQNVLYIVTSLVLMVLIAWIFLMLYHRKVFAEMLHTYSVLNMDSIKHELERIAGLKILIESNKFNSSACIHLARERFANQMPQEMENIAISQLCLADIKDLKNQAKDNQDFFLHDRNDSQITQSSKFSYGRSLSMFWWVFAMVLSLIVSWGVEAMILVSIDSIVSQTDTMKELGMLNSEYGINFHKNFAKFYRTSPYIVLYSNLTQIRQIVSRLDYHTKQQEYLEWWSSWQGQLRETLGTDNAFEIFQVADICKLTQKDPTANIYQNNWPVRATANCSTALKGIIKKGFFHHVMYESNTLDSIKASLENILSKADNLSQIELQIKLSELWMRPEYINLRVWHELVFSRILDITATEVEAGLQVRETEAQISVDRLLQIGIFLAILPLIFYLSMIVPLINYNYRVCLHTFDVISPQAIISSQLSMNKFKRYFRLLNN